MIMIIEYDIIFHDFLLFDYTHRRVSKRVYLLLGLSFSQSVFPPFLSGGYSRQWRPI